MAIFETNEGSIELADSLMVAVARNGEFAADLTAETLKQMFPDIPLNTFHWPLNFLLEFGAMLQIGYWEIR